jgi:deoxyadenosine/deoxycytidine kinase
MKAKPRLPRFLVFEGVSGTGKSTLAELVADKYKTLSGKEPIFLGLFQDPNLELWAIGYTKFIIAK